MPHYRSDIHLSCEVYRLQQARGPKPRRCPDVTLPLVLQGDRVFVLVELRPLKLSQLIVYRFLFAFPRTPETKTA